MAKILQSRASHLATNNSFLLLTKETKIEVEGKSIVNCKTVGLEKQIIPQVSLNM